ncbi:MAG TPA: pyrimidine dimer DNA glycosylase/endonuclease V [Burkholderiales bacterium]|nr:pyrimidine dimer DNA glycosylase/endonuclease V [Burkholderiales bacterium]
MRLWTIHPRYLDAKGLTALWREGLLALAVLRGVMVGYRHHPQLQRFQRQDDPAGCMRTYLAAVLAEADARGYRFARSKLRGSRSAPRMIETTGQIRYELAHLRRKLRKRDPRRHRALSGIKQPAEHPMFRIVRGVVRDWEKKKLKPRMNAGKRRQSSGR